MNIDMHEMSQEEEDRLWDIVDSYTTNKTKPNNMESIYDEQIKRLTANPKAILGSWGSGEGIFKMISDDKQYGAGCLSMIRNNAARKNSKPFVAIIKGQVDEKITAEIQADERIPADPEHITPAHFPAFKEWHMRIDKLQNE